MKKSIGAKDFLLPTPTLIIGTYDEDGAPNAMNAAWGGISSSEPPTIAISIRGERKTYKNILKKNEFTIGIADEKNMALADYLGMKSGNKGNKFEGIAAAIKKAEHVDAPYIDEFPVTIECRVSEIRPVGKHMHIIGEVVNIIADEAVLDEKGNIDVTKVHAIGYDPAGGHYVAFDRIAGKAFSAGAELLKNNK